MAYQECRPSELNIFAPTALQSSIIQSDEIEYQNLNSLDNASVIEFNVVNKSTDTYIDLSSITLHFQIQAVKLSNGGLYKETTTGEGAGQVTVDAKASQPSTVNNMLSSLIKSVNVFINNVLVSSCPLYSYKAYIDTILNYGNDALQSQLTLSGFFKDDGDKYDDVTDTNSGSKYRRELLNNSAIIKLFSKLDVDVFSTPRLLLNGLDLKIVLNLNDEEFYFMETGKSKIVIHKAAVYVRHCQINHNILLEHHKLLNSQKALYPFSRTNIKTFTIPPGIQSIQIDNIVNGILPSSLIFGFVQNEAFHGSKKLSPFNFQTFNLESFTLYKNGIPISGHPLILTSGDPTRFFQSYRSLFLNTQSLYKDTSTIIDYPTFLGGSYLLPINLSPTLELSGSLCSSLLKQGGIKVDLKYRTVTDKTITMIVYTETPSMFTIDRFRNVEISN